MTAYTPPLAPPSFISGSITDVAKEPAKTPEKYIKSTLQLLCTISRGKPSASRTIRLTIK